MEIQEQIVPKKITFDNLIGKRVSCISHGNTGLILPGMASKYLIAISCDCKKEFNTFEELHDLYWVQKNPKG